MWHEGEPYPYPILMLLIIDRRESTEQFAKRCGITYRCLCYILNGEHKPTKRTRQKIADANDMDPDYLFTEGDDAYKLLDEQLKRELHRNEQRRAAALARLRDADEGD